MIETLVLVTSASPNFIDQTTISLRNGDQFTVMKAKIDLSSDLLTISKRVGPNIARLVPVDEVVAVSFGFDRESLDHHKVAHSLEAVIEHAKKSRA